MRAANKIVDPTMAAEKQTRGPIPDLYGREDRQLKMAPTRASVMATVVAAGAGVSIHADGMSDRNDAPKAREVAKISQQMIPQRSIKGLDTTVAEGRSSSSSGQK